MLDLGSKNPEDGPLL